MKRMLICIFVLLMLLSSCGKKDPYMPYLPQSAFDHLEETIENEGKDTDTQDSREAFSFSPCDGVKVDVPKDGLYEDTELKIEPVTEDTPHMKEMIEDFRNQNAYVLRAWEVDAGLSADEALPDAYTMSIDLEELEIPESLRPYVEIVRATDDGEYITLNSEINGNILTFSSRHNSVEMMIYRLGNSWTNLPIPNAGRMLEYKTRWYYLRELITKGKMFWFQDYKTDNGSFTLVWCDEDLDPARSEKSKRIDEITKKYTEEIRNDTTIEKRSSWDVFGLFSSNATEAELLKERLDKDEEYQKLQKELSSPPMLNATVSYITTAFTFLNTVAKVEMPEGKINFYVRNDISQLGNSCFNWGDLAFIEIGMQDAAVMNQDTEKGNETRTNLLLTLTHELFHVCQENYHSHYFSDSTRFDEMTAVVLESDARDYYFDNGMISVKPPLTDQHHWVELEDSTDDNSLGEVAQRNQGYNLSLFYMFLREKTGKKAPVGDIMNARGYFAKPVTSDILSKVFELTPPEYEANWIAFCKKYRDAAAALTKLPNPKIKQDKYEHVNLACKGSYSMHITNFVQTEKTPMPLLLIPDNLETVNDPRATYLPVGTYYPVRNGFYIPAQPGDHVTSENNRRYVIEIFGKQTDEPITGGYTVWGFGKTPKVTMDVDYFKDLLLIEMSGYSEMATSGAVEGIYIKLETDNNYKTETHRTVQELYKGLTLSFDKLYQGDKTKDVNITVTACEYVTDENGTYYYGIESDPVTYKLSGVPDIEVDDTPTDDDPHALSELEQWLNKVAFDYPLEMRCYYAIDNYNSSGGRACWDIVKNLVGQTMTIDQSGHFRFSMPTTSADYAHESKVSEKGNQTKYYGSRTLSFSFEGHMVPKHELHPENYPDWDPRAIDWGTPVIDGVSLTMDSENHERGTFNSGSARTFDSEGRLTADDFSEGYYLGSFVTYGYYLKDDYDNLDYLEDNEGYLVVRIDIDFEGRYVGIEDEWWDKSGYMDAHSHHHDWDYKTSFDLGLYFVSEKPVSDTVRSYYEQN